MTYIFVIDAFELLKYDSLLPKSGWFWGAVLAVDKKSLKVAILSTKWLF